MELPIAATSSQNPADVLRRAVHRASIVFGRIAAEENAIEGAQCFTNPDRPNVRSANFAAELSADGGAALLHEIDDHFACRNAVCHTILGPETDWPVTFQEALVQRGFQPVTRHVLRLERTHPIEHRQVNVQIIPARAAYKSLTGLYQRMAEHEHHADPRLVTDLTATCIDRLDEHRLDLFVARVERDAACVAGVLCLGQIGLIDPAYCDPRLRGQGIATALMAHVLEHCRRAMFEHVIVDRSEGCPAIPFYESLGFTKAASYVKYRRLVP